MSKSTVMQAVTSKSILMHENGGPEKMVLEDVEVGKPGPGQVKVKHTAIGLNFIDIYTRSGLYQMPLAARPPASSSRSAPRCAASRRAIASPIAACWAPTARSASWAPSNS